MVGHVGARDQQHETDGAEQHHEPSTRVTDDVILKGHHPGASTGFPFRKLRIQGTCDSLHGHVGLPHANAGFQSAKHDPVVAVSRVSRIVRPAKRERNVQVRGLGIRDRILEARRHDADDFPGLFVEVNVFAEHVSGAEFSTPESIAEDHDVIASLDFVVGREQPPETRRRSEN
jgi:hypothetical protein